MKAVGSFTFVIKQIRLEIVRVILCVEKRCIKVWITKINWYRDRSWKAHEVFKNESQKKQWQQHWLRIDLHYRWTEIKTLFALHGLPRHSTREFDLLTLSPIEKAYFIQWNLIFLLCSYLCHFSFIVCRRMLMNELWFKYRLLLSIDVSTDNLFSFNWTCPLMCSSISLKKVSC